MARFLVNVSANSFGFSDQGLTMRSVEANGNFGFVVEVGNEVLLLTDIFVQRRTPQRVYNIVNPVKLASRAWTTT